MNDRENSFVGDNALKIYDTIKNWSLKTKYPVGALIPKTESHEWDKFRKKCKQYGIDISGGGFMFALKWANKILDATCPIAEETGYHPFGLSDDFIEMYVNLLKKIDKEMWVEKSNGLRKEIVTGTEKQILIIIKKINDSK